MATAGRDVCIIMAAAVPWEGPRHRQQEIAARLAARYRVLYLEPPADPLKLWGRPKTVDSRSSGDCRHRALPGGREARAVARGRHPHIAQGGTTLSTEVIVQGAKITAVGATHRPPPWPKEPEITLL